MPCMKFIAQLKTNVKPNFYAHIEGGLAEGRQNRGYWGYNRALYAVSA